MAVTGGRFLYLPRTCGVLMRAFASFIVQRRVQAVLIAAGFALLSLLVPPAGYVSGAAVALVTLYRGALEGLLIIGGATAGAAVLALLMWGDAAPALAFVLGMWLPLWLLAMVWRSTVSLAQTLQAAAGIGVVLVVLMHLVLSDPAAWWRDFLDVLRPAMEQAGLFGSGEGVEHVLETAARAMTGLMAAGLVFSLMISLIIARWWQAALYNPGGFQREFHALRLGRGAAVALVVVLVLSLVDGVAAVANDIAMVGVAMYLFQGLALVHRMVAAFHAHALWLVGLYVVMVLVAPQMVLLLSAMGFADTWLDFRARLPGVERK